MQRITPQFFYKYLTCPHWPWFDLFGDHEKEGEVNELQQKILEHGVVHEEQFMAKFVDGHEVVKIDARNWEEGLVQTRRAMENGVEYIYQGRLRDRDYEGIPDLLVRRPGKSKLGDYFYEPLDIKSGFDLKEDYKYQLTLYALTLEVAQQFRPPHAGIITPTGELLEFAIEDFENKFFDMVEKLEHIFAGEKPPLQLTKACMNSPWYSCCVEQAEATDDIALLYKLDKRSLDALRGFGIRTVEDARQVDVNALGDSIPYLKRNGLDRMKLQAESLKTQKIILRHPVTLPTAPLEIYFDIEGDPLTNVEYLFGFLVDDHKNEPQYIPFIAEKPEDERAMWRAFLDWMLTLPTNMVVFHYATYEKSRLSFLARKYAGDMSELDHVALGAFTGKLVDLNDTIKDNFIFPLYFYGLKPIGKFLGFHWDSDKAGGAQSIYWYEEWLRTGNRTVLDTVIQYNKDDVVATKFLRDWIVKYVDIHHRDVD